MAMFLRRGRRGFSPFMALVLGMLAYRSLTKGKGHLAALIGASAGRAGRLGALMSTVLHQVLHGVPEEWQGGPQRPSGPRADGDLEEALGEERIRWLMSETGMTREELMEGLRRFHGRSG